MNQKIKVLVISHLFPNPYKTFLGIAVYDRIMELSKHFEVKVIAPVPWAPKFKYFNPYYEYCQIPFREKINGIEIFHPRYFTLPKTYLYSLDGLSYFLAINNLVKQIYKKWRFQLIDAHQSFPDGFNATLIAKKLNPRPRVVTTIHGADVFGLQRFSPRRWMVKSGILNSNAIIADSLNTKRRINLVTEGVEVNIIPTGITLKKEIEPLPGEITKKLRGRLVILTVGYLIKRKGHRYVILALKRLVKKYRNLIYLIVGEGPQKAELEKLVLENNLGEHVIFTGGIPNSQIPACYLASDIFILPSWDEALGVVYMEAMSYSKPVIGCLGEGAQELIDNNINGFLIQAKNVEQTKETLERLAKNSKLRLKVGKLAKEKAYREFTQDHRMRQQKKLFLKVLDA